jgi:hypothetical protein
MKLSEFSTDEALDVLCEITPYINNIIIDNALMETLKAKVKGDGLTKTEIMALGAEKLNKLLPIILKDHRVDVYGIVAVLNGIDAADIGRQNIIKTAAQVRDAVKDKDLVDFFKSCAEPERSE